MPAPLITLPVFLVFMAQITGAIMGLLVWRYAPLILEDAPLILEDLSGNTWLPVIFAGGFAAFIGKFVLRLSTWWMVINATFIPAVIGTITLGLPDWIFLVAFTLTLAVFWNVRAERVPLYLTNPLTGQALSELLTGKTGVRFIDLGCGLSGTLRFLARQHPDIIFSGVENAPIPLLISKFRQWIAPIHNLTVSHGNIWNVDLSEFDVAYCFLSPAPMAHLYEKVKNEMSPGGLFISNSFEVSGIPPQEVLTVDDSRKTRLLIWRL